MKTLLKIIVRYKVLILIVLGVITVGVILLKLDIGGVVSLDSGKNKTAETQSTTPSSPSSSTDVSADSNKSTSTDKPASATKNATPSSTATATNPGSTPPTQTTPPATPVIPPASTYCGAYPSVPNSECTGWRHTGVTLRSVPEQVTSGTGWSWEGSPFNYVKITGDGAVLDSLDIHGCVYIDNTVGVQTVTVKRSRVTGSCDYLFRLGDFNVSTNVQLQDVELVGSAVQMKGSGYSWNRVDSHAFTGKAAMMGSNTVVQNSYIHDNACNPPDHQSGIGTNGGATNIQMIHNNIDLLPGDCTSGGIANYDDFGAFSDVLIQNNLINSAGYCLKAGFEQGAASGNTMRVISNTFGRKYFPECGYWGVVSNWLTGSGNVWSGNVWGSGAAATTAHELGSAVNP